MSNKKWISESLKNYVGGKKYQREIGGRRRKRIEIILKIMGLFVANYLKELRIKWKTWLE